jgi:hypothetical protein
MTLRFAEHCDNATSTAGIVSRGWSGTTYAGFTTTGGRTGGGGLANNTTDGTTIGWYRTMSLGNGLVRTAMWFKATMLPPAESWLVRWSNAALNQHGGIKVATTGVVKAFAWSSGSPAAAGTGTINVCDGGWHYIETECYFADSGGSLKVWTDGSAEINVSGDTLDSGTVALDVLRVCMPVASSYIDDLLVWDDTGSGLTGNLGGKALIMKTLRPTSDAGVQFTPSTGANYACVDDVALATSDYVEDGTSGHLDRYGFADTGLTSETVKAVIVEALAANPGAGAISLKLLSELSSTTDESAAMALAGATGVFQNAFTTKPGGGAWAMANIDAATFGIKVA